MNVARQIELVERKIEFAVARLLPGVLGNAESHRDDSFAPGGMASLLEGPVYTRPPVWRGREVPEAVDILRRIIDGETSEVVDRALADLLGL